MKSSLAIKDKDYKILGYKNFDSQEQMNIYVYTKLLTEYPNCINISITYNYGLEYYKRVCSWKKKKLINYEKKNHINNDKQ